LKKKKKKEKKKKEKEEEEEEERKCSNWSFAYGFCFGSQRSSTAGLG
jgi:hypothetical protein